MGPGRGTANGSLSAQRPQQVLTGQRSLSPPGDALRMEVQLKALFFSSQTGTPTGLVGPASPPEKTQAGSTIPSIFPPGAGAQTLREQEHGLSSLS